MTISSVVRTAGPFLGTGVAISCAFQFKVFLASDLLVQTVDSSGLLTQLALSTDYTVTLNVDQNNVPGGTVTLLAVLAVGSQLIISSAVPLTQPLSIPNLSGFFPKNIEDALDRLTISIQQQNIFSRQNLRVPELSGTPALATAAARANRLLGFDGQGNPIATLPTGGDATSLAIDLLNATNAAKGPGQIGFAATLSYVAGTVGAKLRQFLSILDFGGTNTSISDDTTAEALTFAQANPARTMFMGDAAYKIPRRSLKVFRPTHGITDRASVMSLIAGSNTEGLTQVMGFSQDSDVTGYSSRDSVVAILQQTAQPPLVTTPNTTFTANSVTSADFAAAIAAGSIEFGMLIDTNETPKKTGFIKSITGNTLVVGAWYIDGTSAGTGTPTNGATVYVNPCTKAFVANEILEIPANALATRGAVCEIDILNSKTDNITFGYDFVQQGSKASLNAIQIRKDPSAGVFTTGIEVFQGSTGVAGFVSHVNAMHSYSDGDGIGWLGQSNVHAFIAKNASGFAFQCQDAAGNYLGGLDGFGRAQRPRLFSGVYTNGQTIDGNRAIAIVSASSATTVNLPDPTTSFNTERELNLHNASGSTVSVLFAGVAEGGAGGFTVAPGRSIHIFSDGAKWIPLAQF